jgi:hypothetical protein
MTGVVVVAAEVEVAAAAAGETGESHRLEPATAGSVPSPADHRPVGWRELAAEVRVVVTGTW